MPLLSTRKSHPKPHLFQTNIFLKKGILLKRANEFASNLALLKELVLSITQG